MSHLDKFYFSSPLPPPSPLHCQPFPPPPPPPVRHKFNLCQICSPRPPSYYFLFFFMYSWFGFPREGGGSLWTRGAKDKIYSIVFSTSHLRSDSKDSFYNWILSLTYRAIHEKGIFRSSRRIWYWVGRLLHRLFSPVYLHSVHFRTSTKSKPSHSFYFLCSSLLAK